ncbi:MAG TPA: DMT family transporter [Candidatus Dormibacteraeota bacterium]
MGFSALAAALWGGLYVVSQLAFQDRLPPVTVSFVRLAIGAAALVAVLRRLPGIREPRLAGLGALVAVTVLVQSYGTLLAGAATGSLLTLMTPVFVALLAPLVLHEPTRLLQWLGIALGIAGALLIAGLHPGGSVLGDLLLVAASLSWALFTVGGARLVRERGALAVTTGASLWALPLVLVAALIELALGATVHVSPGGVLALVYLGLGATALGWWAWYRGVAVAPAASAAVPFLLQPLVGVGLAQVLFHGEVSIGLLAGGLLVAAGMLAASRA